MMQDEKKCKLNELLSLFSEDKMVKDILEYNLEYLDESIIKKLIHYQFNDNLNAIIKQTEVKIFDEV